jgi:hypothetical protein
MSPFGFPIDPFQAWLDDPANKPILGALSNASKTNSRICVVTNPGGSDWLRDVYLAAARERGEAR